MPNPSFYFNLFKKFQVLNHVPASTVHGSASPTGGFDLKNPAAVFGSSNRGSLLGPTTTPADSPLWAVLNSRAMGNAGFTPVNVGGVSWPTMPTGSPPAWNDFQVTAPAPKLVQVFADWIIAGKINDIPAGVIGAMPPPITSGLTPGIDLFVCSVAGDNGDRPGTVPPNFWATSLIFLVDPSTGAIVTPSSLGAASEYYLTAVIGNRGNAAAGHYMTPSAAEVQAAGWVMVWNSGTSPAVQLPALSNLDVNAIDGTYGVYFLRAGQYDVVGFRLRVQTVFDGLVKAIGASGMDLGGLTPEQWVHAEGAHLCAKVLVRKLSDPWPVLGATPFTDKRLAQKNLAPFAIDLAVVDPDPNIIWRNFVLGDVIQMAAFTGGPDEELGRHTLTVQTKLPEGVAGLFLAVPERSFARWLKKGSLGNLKRASEDELRGVKPPFPEHVILALPPGQATFEVPPLGEEFLALSIGVQYSARRLKPGPLGEISVAQHTEIPKIDRGSRCYKLERVIVGGFTWLLEGHDPFHGQDPRDMDDRRTTA